MAIRLLFTTAASGRTVLLADPSRQVAAAFVTAFGKYLKGAVRVVSSPEDPPWGKPPPPWVRESWYRALWLGLPAAERDRLALVASREPTRLQQLDPTRCRSVVALFDPYQRYGCPIQQWTATGDLLQDMSRLPRSSGGIAAVEQVASAVTLVAADDPLNLVTVVAGELGIGPKRAERLAAALAADWPSFRQSKRPPHWLDVELYALALGGSRAENPAIGEALVASTDDESEDDGDEV